MHFNKNFEILENSLFRSFSFCYKTKKYCNEDDQRLEIDDFNGPRFILDTTQEEEMIMINMCNIVDMTFRFLVFSLQTEPKGVKNIQQVHSFIL